MKIYIGAWLFILLNGMNPAFGQSETKKIHLGESHTFFTSNLNENRTINIHYPSNYNQNNAYPVVYLLDGSLHEDFMHVVGLFQFFQLQFNCPPMIIVGIENVDRKRDFTFQPMDKKYLTEYPEMGKSANFIEYLAEVKTYITNTCSTNNDSYLIGQSLGGLLASEILVKNPSLFSNYFIVSPSLWWDNQSLLKLLAESVSNAALNKVSVSIVVGADEHIVMRKTAKRMHKILQKTGVKKVDYTELKNENHATVLHNALYWILQQYYQPR